MGQAHHSQMVSCFAADGHILAGRFTSDLTAAQVGEVTRKRRNLHHGRVVLWEKEKKRERS